MRRFAVGAALVLALAGCGGDPKADPTSTPSAPVTTPASTTPSPPVMPEAAKADTKAGAIAFVRHYVALINHAQATGDVDVLSAVESATCMSCQRVRDTITNIYGSAGRIQGGDWNAQIRSAETRPDLEAWSVFADVWYGPQTVVRSTGTSHLNGGKGPMTFVVRSVEGEWIVIRWSRGS